MPRITTKKSSTKKDYTKDWFIEEADFKITGTNSDTERERKYYETTRLYKVWFELLKISPSIRKIHELGIEKASNYSKYSVNMGAVYNDFHMEEVFNQPLLFKDWWIKYGQSLFHRYSNTNGVHFFGAIPEGASKQYANNWALLGFNDFLDIHRGNNGKDGFLVFAASLSSNRKEMVAHFDRVVKGVFESLEEDPTPNTEKPKYEASNKAQLETLNRLINLLHRAMDLPDITEQWKIGFDVGVYEAGTNNHTYNTLPYEKRKTLIEKTSTEMKRAKYLMKNAAIGKFPCFDEIDISDINFVEMAAFRNLTIKNEKRFIKQQIKANDKLRAKENIDIWEVRKKLHELNSL